MFGLYRFLRPEQQVRGVLIFRHWIWSMGIARRIRSFHIRHVFRSCHLHPVSRGRVAARGPRPVDLNFLPGSEET